MKTYSFSLHGAFSLYPMHPRRAKEVNSADLNLSDGLRARGGRFSRLWLHLSKGVDNVGLFVVRIRHISHRFGFASASLWLLLGRRYGVFFFRVWKESLFRNDECFQPVSLAFAGCECIPESNIARPFLPLPFDLPLKTANSSSLESWKENWF